MTRGEALLAWYDAHRRDLPWRHTTDPYRILVSEVMLQQTQVSRVVPAYESFLKLFPDERALADAPLEDVLAAWQGLGYPIRARRLRQAMRTVVEMGWPTTAADLRRLPGVGPYTAAAVASFAFGERVAVVDTNVRRVFSRWEGKPLAGAGLERSADSAIAGDPAVWNQAVMELGALVCRPTPVCGECPVTTWCADPSVYVVPPRQSRFEGSIRQVRGAILRHLAARGPSRIDDLPGEPDRVAAAVAGLADDGLIVVGDGVVSIGD